MFFLVKGNIRFVSNFDAHSLDSNSFFEQPSSLSFFASRFSLPKRFKSTVQADKSLEYDSKGNISESCKWLAEASLWSPWKHTCTVEAASVCDVMSIDACKFAELVAEDATFWLKIRQYANSFVKWLNDQAELCCHGGLDLGPHRKMLHKITNSAFLTEGGSVGQIVSFESPDAIQSLVNGVKSRIKKSTYFTCAAARMMGR